MARPEGMMVATPWPDAVQIAEAMANRYTGRGIERDDLIQIAILGMLGAPDEAVHAAVAARSAIVAAFRDWGRSSDRRHLDIRTRRAILLRYLDCPEGGPGDVAELAEDVERLRDALDRLPRREAEAIRLRFGIGGEEHTQARAAAILGVDERTIRRLEARGLARLRRALAD